MENLVAVPTRFRLQEELDERYPPMSQRELASISKVSPTTINRMCKNLTAQVSLATLDAISDALKVAPGDLLERVEPGDLLEREGKKRRAR